MSKNEIKSFIIESNKLLFEKAPTEEELKQMYKDFLDTLTGHDEAPSFEDFKEYYEFDMSGAEAKSK